MWNEEHLVLKTQRFGLAGDVKYASSKSSSFQQSSGEIVYVCKLEITGICNISCMLFYYMQKLFQLSFFEKKGGKKEV